MLQKLYKQFTPLYFLASLGAGGMTVAFFAFVQYTLPHGAGLVTATEMRELAVGVQYWVYAGAEVGMVVFAVLHVFLTVLLAVVFVRWLRVGEWRAMWNSPLTNGAFAAPIISLTMTMNVFIAPVRYFFDGFAANLQSVMLPGFLFWLLLFFVVMAVELVLLKKAFVDGFDIEKIHFGWLLHPFALGMVSVTGMGIAALAQSTDIATTAALLSLVTLTMGMFLFTVKVVTLFSRQFAKSGLPEVVFLPSLLIVLPNITLFAISMFRFEHFLAHHYGIDGGVLALVAILGAFVFETWYLLFGLLLLKDYFREHLRSSTFHVSQWGLVCPFVAYAVLASFVFGVFVPAGWLFWGIVAVLVFTAMLIAYLIRNNMNALLRS
jgi:tellurite resistance protein TehA-like permease